MIIPLTQATEQQGQAAARSALVATVVGHVLTTDAMDASLDERQEQINALLNVYGQENAERVAAELGVIIHTVHVPKQVENEIEHQAFDTLEKPVLMRLSPVGKVADPLEPAIVLGIEDKKAVLDALRMLYAEMYTAPNLATGDTNRHASIIMQPMPRYTATFRVFTHNHFTIIEAEQGYGALVNFGEPDRFLYENGALTAHQPGNAEGIFFEKHIVAKKREEVSKELGEKVYAYAHPLLEKARAPLLIGLTPAGELSCLGCLHPLH
jgi:hypothetical protein